MNIYNFMSFKAETMLEKEEENIMFDLLDRLYIIALCSANAFIKDEDGAVDLVTIVVLIGIAVVLAVLFRTRIQALLTTLFDTIDKGAEKAVK